MNFLKKHWLLIVLALVALFVVYAAYKAAKAGLKLLATLANPFALVKMFWGDVAGVLKAPVQAAGQAANNVAASGAVLGLQLPANGPGSLTDVFFNSNALPPPNDNGFNLNYNGPINTAGVLPTPPLFGGN